MASNKQLEKLTGGPSSQNSITARATTFPCTHIEVNHQRKHVKKSCALDTIQDTVCLEDHSNAHFFPLHSSGSAEPDVHKCSDIKSLSH